MTIDEAIYDTEEVKDYFEACNEPSKGLGVAIDIMRKYQKIKEILNDDSYYEYYGSKAETFIVSAICEVVKDENDK